MSRPKKDILTGHPERITNLAFSADGKRLVSSASLNNYDFSNPEKTTNPSIIIWDLTQNKPTSKILTEEIINKGINKIVLSADGKKLLSLNINAILWDISNLDTITYKMLNQKGTIARGIAMCCNGKKILCREEDISILYAIDDSNIVANPVQYFGHLQEGKSTISADGTTIALAHFGALILLKTEELLTQEEIKTIRNCSKEQRSLIGTLTIKSLVKKSPTIMSFTEYNIFLTLPLSIQALLKKKNIIKITWQQWLYKKITLQ